MTPKGPAMGSKVKHRSRFVRREGGTSLLVLVHAWRQTPSNLAPLVELLAGEEEMEGYDFLLFGYNASKMSNQRLASVAETLATEIASYDDEHGYEAISLLGHSIGGLIARQAYLLANGLSSVHPEAFAHSWGEKVAKGRIVLLATPNRGSSLLERSWFERQRVKVAELFDVARLIRDAFRGSEFVTNLRLDWIRAIPSLGEAAPTVVLILGENDREVTTDDSIDVTQFRNASHSLVKDEDHNSLGRIGDRTELKYRLILSALARPIDRPPSRTEPPAAERVDTIVFLVHGIRDYGAWLRRVRKRIEAEIPHSRVIEAKYRYFTLSSFLWRPARLRRVMAFRDQYSQALARYPGAAMHFVGHSFGTYILANSLQKFRSMRFDRVYFAGSVVPRQFDWQSSFEAGQIAALRNDCAASDYPVGFLCSALQTVWSRDLGTGGFRGFLPGLYTTRVDENRYFRGGHGAAVADEENLASVVRFIAADSPDDAWPEPGGRLAADVSPLLGFLSKAAPIVLVVGALVVLSLLGLLSYFLFPWGAVVALVVLVYFLFFY